MTDQSLSPAAQAVLAAYRADWRDEQLKQDVKCLAAALRAAADQVLPADGNSWKRWPPDIRRDILAIAQELEIHQ